jgi:hypothetical protein
MFKFPLALAGVSGMLLTLATQTAAQTVSNRPAGVDCYGKTLADRRSSGRVMEFKPTK